MMVETKVMLKGVGSNSDTVIDTIASANVALKFFAGDGLKYKPTSGDYTLVDKIESSVDASGPTKLTITIESGSGWHIEGSEGRISIAGGDTNGGLQWTYTSSIMEMVVIYPSRKGANISMDLYDPDAPKVKLDVVVKRI